MLAEVTRQILHLLPESREQAHAIRIEIETDCRHIPRQGVGGIGELELIHHLRQPIDLSGLEAERFADLARGAAAAVGDHVGRHPRAQPAVLLVDVLDDPLAPVAARQIEVDVGPFAAFFRQEPLEQQVHADRIDRGDAEAVAHGAVGRRAAALDEDVVLTAEVHDVPDDQEVAGELELLDEIELARNLGARPIVERSIAIARPDLGDPAEERALGFASRHRVLGKSVAEVGHRVLQPVSQLGGVRQRLRMIAEERRHLVRRLQVPLGIARQAAAGLHEIGVVVNTREHVEQRARCGRREADAVGDDGRHTERGSHLREDLVGHFFVAVMVPLQLDVGPIPPEHAHQPIEQSADAEASRVERRPARQRDEAGGLAVELLQRERPFAFRGPHFHAGHQTAQVPVPVGGFTQDRQEPGFCAFSIFSRGPTPARRRARAVALARIQNRASPLPPARAVALARF